MVRPIRKPTQRRARENPLLGASQDPSGARASASEKLAVLAPALLVRWPQQVELTTKGAWKVCLVAPDGSIFTTTMGIADRPRVPPDWRTYPVGDHLVTDADTLAVCHEMEVMDPWRSPCATGPGNGTPDAGTDDPVANLGRISAHSGPDPSRLLLRELVLATVMSKP